MKRLNFTFNLSKIVKFPLVIILVGLFSASVLAKGGIQELTSPDNNIKVRIELADKIFYSISANNFLLMEKRLEMGLRQVAGFYLPKENTAFFYDSGTTEGFLHLTKLASALNRKKEYHLTLRKSHHNYF